MASENGTELAKAYVQIIPSALGIKGKITEALGGEASSAGDAAGESFASKLVSKAKTIIAAAGLGKILTSAISEGADLQQSLGGIETLFKESADTMKAYANEAYKTAGLSANDYMETATSFAASLVSGLGGDTSAAAKLANTAITDMADNANKMGTDMQSIQNAYQGFAKQNYTMLDNLKLGYGGTQSEMVRLINDSGILNKTIKNLDDVTFDQMIEAIHVVQGNLGITGTTALEAAETFSGSLASMKSAWSNLLGNLTLGNDLTDSLDALGDTVATFVSGNLIPLIENIFSALPSTLGKMVVKIAPGLIKSGAGLVGNLAKGIISSGPDLFDAVMGMLQSAREYISGDFPSVSQEGVSYIEALAKGFLNSVPAVLDGIGQIEREILFTLSGAVPELLESGVELISGLAEGFMEALPDVLLIVGELLNNIVLAAVDYLPMFLQAGIDLLDNIMQGIALNAPNALLVITDSLALWIDTIVMSLPEFLTKGGELILMLIQGFLEGLPVAITAVGGLLNDVLASILEYLPEVLQIGMDIIGSLAQGTLDNIPAILAAAAEVIGKLLGTLMDSLPDILQKGVEMVGSLAGGIVDNLPTLLGAAAEIIAGLLAEIAEHFSDLLQSGIELVGEVASGLIEAIPDLVMKIPEIIKSIVDAFMSFDWLSIGKDIIGGIGEGIKGAAGALWDGIKSVGSDIVGGFKSFFHIGSPSKLMRDEIGQFIPSGIAVGIEENMKPIQDAMRETTNMTVKSANNAVASGTLAASDIFHGQNGNKGLEDKMDAVLKMLAKYLPDCAKETVIDGDSLVKEINRGLGLAVM